VTVADLTSVLLYGAMTASLGALILRAVSAPALLRNGAAAYLAGQLVWLGLFLAMSWLHVPMTVCVWSVGMISVVGWGILSCKRWRHWSSPGGLLFLLIVAVSFPQAIYLVARVPLIEWDARSIWFFHGKAIWNHAGISTDYFANPHYVWSHTDYPLLIPVQAAVVAMLRGAWSEMAVKGFLVGNFAAYLWLLRAILRKRGWPRLDAWAVAVLVMGIALPAYLNGYADNHYAMPLMLAALVLFRPLPGEGGSALAGLMAVFALNLKNESAMYVFVGVAFWAVWWVLRDVKRVRERLGQCRFSSCGLAILLLGAIPFLLWSLFKAVHGLEGDLHLSSRLTDPAALAQGVERVSTILEAMGIVHNRMFTPALLGITVALSIWRCLLSRREHGEVGALLSLEERALWVLLLLIHLLIFAVYALTPYNVWWHLGTSLDRLLVLPVLILVGLLMVTAGRVLDYSADMK